MVAMGVAATTMSTHRFDHGAAKAFWVSLPPEEATYVRVARQFGVSETTIRKWARVDGWVEAREAAWSNAASKALARAALSVEDRAGLVVRLTDALLLAFIRDLDAKAEQATFHDLERMVKLVQLLTGEATDRVSFVEAQQLIGQVLDVARRWAVAELPPAERQSGLVAEVRELLEGDADA